MASGNYVHGTRRDSTGTLEVNNRLGFMRALVHIAYVKQIRPEDVEFDVWGMGELGDGCIRPDRLTKCITGHKMSRVNYAPFPLANV